MRRVRVRWLRWVAEKGKDRVAMLYQYKNYNFLLSIVAKRHVALASYYSYLEYFPILISIKLNDAFTSVINILEQVAAEDMFQFAAEGIVEEGRLLAVGEGRLLAAEG